MDSRTKLRWPYFLDGALDGIVVAFAAWTVFYQFALVFQFSMLWAGWPWIVLAAVLAVAGGMYASRSTSPDLLGDEPAEGAPSPARSVDLKVLAVGSALVVFLVLKRETWGVWPVAITAIMVLAVQLLPWLKPRLPVSETGPSATQTMDVGRGAHLLALALSLAFGILGLFLLRPDADDAYYVNRATWVAQHGTAATNDTMFGPNVLPPAVNGGLSTPSIESLQGVVAHSIGVQAPTLCYLIVVPLLGAMAGWMTWRLVRAWSPGRPAMVMLAAMVFLVASGDSIVGNYSLGRIWQGKATAYLILIPLVWLLLSRTTHRARRYDMVMLAAAGVAFVGLTTSSALLAPVIAGSALLAAVILRSKTLALGSVVFFAAPLINGLAQAFGPAAIGGGGDNSIVAPQNAFSIEFGVSAAMVLLGVLAMVCVPRLIPGSTGVILACAAVATMAALMPGVFELADAATGAGAVAWRLVIAMPIWVLVGLVVAMPLSGRPRQMRRRHATWTPGAGVLAAVVIVVPLVFGTFLWTAPGASLTERPTWKVNQEALSDVRAVQDLDTRGGLLLMPPAQMEILSISTVGPFAVVPRVYYMPALEVPSQERADRMALFTLVTAPDRVGVRKVRGALERLDISVACVSKDSGPGRSLLRRAAQAKLKSVGHLRCVEP